MNPSNTENLHVKRKLVQLTCTTALLLASKQHNDAKDLCSNYYVIRLAQIAFGDVANYITVLYSATGLYGEIKLQTNYKHRLL